MRHLHPSDDRQCHGESACVAHRVDRVAVPCCRFRLFCHWSPFRHVVFDISTCRLLSVRGVITSGSGAPADPLTDAVSRVLTVPLREVYAVLWRCGVLDIDD
ncbi:MULTISPECIES: Rv1535 domain-containing protein [Mycolicibacterium]|uniref:Rv1535 domain-containing protein n=1 Tax=Mycolicibacterium TaxID=1866885 RepID=UPI001FD290D1|nr:MULTISPECIES: Rv1535 domain-containing protein [Mycolicibacterium]MCW1823750.1 Rv1535 domain-containing protein [Mycolicibacterium senegalense]